VVIKRSVLAAAVAAFFIFIYNLAPGVYVGDSGELIAASSTLGVAHPPGYPVFVIITAALSKIFPAGNIAYRMNFINALFVFSAMLFMCRFTSASLLLYFALAPAVFSSAGACEVFTLNLLFACAIIYLLYSPFKKNALAAAFLFGLGLANHQTLILLLPGVIYLLIKRKMFDFPFVLMVFCAAITGFYANLFLIVRAQSGAVFNWGDPSTFGRWIDVLLRRDYGTFALHGSHHHVTLNALLDYPRLGFIFFGPLFIFIPLLYFSHFRKADGFNHFLFICFLFSGPLFFMAAGLSSSSGAFIEAITERFFLLPSAILIMLAGGLWGFLRRKKIFTSTVWAFALLFIFSIKGQSLRNFYSLSDFADSVIRAVPRGNALIIEKGAVGDDLIFALAYKKWAQKVKMPPVYTSYGAVFPSFYGEDPPRETSGLWNPSPARGYAAKMKFMFSGPEKSFFAFSKSQLPFPDYGFDGLLWTKDALRNRPNPAFFWRTSGLQNYRVRSIEILDYYFRALKNPSPGTARICSHLGKDIDWLLTNMGPVWAGLGRRDEARKSYEAAISINPALPEAWNNLGVLDFGERDYDSAARHFAESVSLTPDDVRYYNLALSLGKLGKTAEAQAAFRKCLNINPVSYAALNELGLIEMRSGNIAGAKEFFQKGLSINPDDENLKYNLALVKNGE